VTTPRPDTRGDGDGWVECAQGHRHWGLYGAAGLLLHRADAGPAEVLLQHRATWSHHGGTWGLLGGARHGEESAVAAALREAAEEGGLDGSQVAVHGQYEDAHGRWSYVTVLATGTAGTAARPTGGESIDVAWVPVDEVPALPLHPGFAQSWPWLRRALRPVTVVVDAANVVGSRPDGWWRDRPGAARRLLDRVAARAAVGLAGTELPDALDRPPASRWWPRWVVVLEGAARAALDAAPTGLDVVAAPGSGDDAIVQVVAGTSAPTLVVTADRELSRRVRELGATVVGPSWLLDL
jgi:8-oxo-dGTP pyrophosphatase MutT (NUDIX family)